MGRIQDMVDHAVAIANDDSHGYSWSDRWNQDRDCSSLMYDSADAAGYDVGRGGGKYTGTMIEDFTAAGFSLHLYGDVEVFPGCIYLRNPGDSSGHTEMYVGDGMNAGAHCSETGGVYGEPGDQTGFEISVSPDSGGWDYVLVPPEDNDNMEDDMNCIFKPDGQGRMVWFDGTRCHDLDHPDEMRAVQEVYRQCTGREIPVFELGSPEAPWAHRFMDAVGHGSSTEHM